MISPRSSKKAKAGTLISPGYAAVLRYRERRGEKYRKADALRKRLARHGRRLRSEVDRLELYPAGTRPIGFRAAQHGVEALMFDLLEHVPDLGIEQLAETLLPQLGARPDGKHGELSPFYTTSWISPGQPYAMRNDLHTFLKQIELFWLEQHNYRALFDAMLTRSVFYCQLLQNPYDGYYEKASRLEGWLAELMEGPLKMTTCSMWSLQGEHALLRLHLAEIRGDLEEVRIQYEAFERFMIPYDPWIIQLEGIRAYTMLGALKRAEQCLADSSDLRYPNLFNEMRRLRSKIMLRLAQHEVDEARATLDCEYRPLCERYRNSADVRFFAAVAEQLGLPQIGYERARLVLIPWLAW